MVRKTRRRRPAKCNTGSHRRSGSELRDHRARSRQRATHGLNESGSRDSRGGRGEHHTRGAVRRWLGLLGHVIARRLAVRQRPGQEARKEDALAQRGRNACVAAVPRAASRAWRRRKGARGCRWASQVSPQGSSALRLTNAVGFAVGHAGIGKPRRPTLQPIVARIAFSFHTSRGTGACHRGDDRSPRIHGAR